MEEEILENVEQEQVEKPQELQEEIIQEKVETSMQEESNFLQEESIQQDFSTQEQINCENKYVFIPAGQEQRKNKTNKLFAISMIASLWGILLCLFSIVGAIFTSLGLTLFLIGSNKPKTTSYKWALSLSIIAVIVTIIFCIVMALPVVPAE